MKLLQKIGTLLLVLALCVGLLPQVCAAQQEATILFTHDLHSHLLPAKGEDGNEYGGYARLMTVIRAQREKHPDAILVDGGDFSMGSLFQTAFATSAIELRMMAAMGYDATTFGNHEFDYLPQGLAAMLHTVADSGEAVPAILECNYLPPRATDAEYDAEAELLWDALNHYGVQDYQILERGGIYYALFGLAGYDCGDCAPNSGMILEEPAVAAQRTVDAARAECLERYGAEPIVVALSHSGTTDGEGEDYELAQAVQGIHLIVSAHTHTTLPEPIQVGNTWIVSAGRYGENLGVATLSYSPSGEIALTDYELIPIDDSVEDDPEIAALVEDFKGEVEEQYLADYGMGFDQVLTQNAYAFDTVDDLYDYAHESTLGNLLSDAYKWAAEQALGSPVDLAITASGVVRASIPLGDVTVSDVFHVASLGVGTEGELVSVWVTGADLKNVFEVDASVYPLMHSAQLFSSGAEYTFNPYRMIFNKVNYAMLRRNDGTLEAIEDDKLYRIVTGMYAGQMLGSVEKTSYGLLTITPRDENGVPLDLDHLEDYVVRTQQGVPVKEWYAIAAYLEQMGGQMDEGYAAADGRKMIQASLNPVNLLKNANRFTYIAMAAGAVVLALVFWVGRIVMRRKKR